MSKSHIKTLYATSAELFDEAIDDVISRYHIESGRSTYLPTPRMFKEKVLDEVRAKTVKHDTDALPKKKLPYMHDLNWYLVARCILVYCDFTFPDDGYLFETDGKGDYVRVSLNGACENILQDETVEYCKLKMKIRRFARSFNPMLTEFDLRSIECLIEDSSKHVGQVTP